MFALDTWILAIRIHKRRGEHVLGPLVELNLQRAVEHLEERGVRDE